MNTTATGSAAISAASATAGRVEWKMSESPTVPGNLLVGQDRIRQEKVVPVGDEAEEEDERGNRRREWSVVLLH